MTPTTEEPTPVPATDEPVPPQAPPAPERDDKGKGYARVIVAECGTNAARFRLKVSIRKLKVEFDYPDDVALRGAADVLINSLLDQLSLARKADEPQPSA